MTAITTYTQARAELASLCDEVASTREPVIIRRPNAEDVALVSADELAGLLETAHLLRSPKNAQRLLAAIKRAQSRKLSPSSVEELRRNLGLVELVAASYGRTSPGVYGKRRTCGFLAGTLSLLTDGVLNSVCAPACYEPRSHL